LSTSEIGEFILLELHTGLILLAAMVLLNQRAEVVLPNEIESNYSSRKQSTGEASSGPTAEHDEEQGHDSQIIGIEAFLSTL
jgi:hypothetical protein